MKWIELSAIELLKYEMNSKRSITKIFPFFHFSNLNSSRLEPLEQFSRLDVPWYNLFPSTPMDFKTCSMVEGTDLKGFIVEKLQGYRI